MQKHTMFLYFSGGALGAKRRRGPDRQTESCTGHRPSHRHPPASPAAATATATASAASATATAAASAAIATSTPHPPQLRIRLRADVGLKFYWRFVGEVDLLTLRLYLLNVIMTKVGLSQKSAFPCARPRRRVLTPVRTESEIVEILTQASAGRSDSSQNVVRTH